MKETKLLKKIAEKEIELNPNIKGKEEYNLEAKDSTWKRLADRKKGKVWFTGEYQENYFIEATLQVIDVKFEKLCTPFCRLDEMPMHDFERHYPLNGEDTNDYSALINFINSDERQRLRNEIRTKMKEDK